MRLRQVRFPWAAPTWPTHAEAPAAEAKLGVDYDGSWSRRYPARLVRAVILDNMARPIVRALAPPRVSGEERLGHLEAPVIFAANHASHVDTPLLLTSLPPRFRHRCVVGAAADHFFDKRWKAVLWSFATAAIPIERQRVSRRSADLAAALITEGWNLVIFPEGGRSPDGWGQEFRGGAAYLAKRTGAPVVPVHLEGTRRVLGKDAGSLRMSPTRVTFGSALTIDEDEDARRFATRIERAVAALADEVGSDWWTARRRAHSGVTPALTGPPVSEWRRAWALGSEDSRGDQRPRSKRSGWPTRAGSQGPWSNPAVARIPVGRSRARLGPASGSSGRPG